MSTLTSLESILSTTADRIHRYVNKSQNRRLQDRIDDWCSLHGLERLDNPTRIVAQQAAFNLLLKASLYEYYHQYGIQPELPSDVRKAFREAEEETGDPAFREYVLDEVAWLANSTELDELLDARHQLQSTGEPVEEIGRLFELFTPQESRRKLGQFHTPTAIADLMAQWVVPKGNERILDPGMGAGALSAAAYHHKQQKANDAALTDIYGVDVNELALVMSATSLNLLDHGGPHNFRSRDFLDLSPTDIDGTVDSVISNPPYSRHHEIPEKYKVKINGQIRDELGNNVSALSPMYAYFYYHVAQFLRDGGRASYITPSEFLETDYGTSLKQYLLETFDIKALVLFDRNETSVFKEATTTSLVSFLKKSEEGDERALTRFIRVDDYPGKDVLMNAIDGGVEGTTEWGFVNIVRQDELRAEDKWTTLFDPIEIDTSQLIPLSEIATVNRGIATGANDYFCLSEENIEEWSIEEKYLSKLIRNARSVPHFDYRNTDWERQRKSGNEVWLLYHLEELDQDTIACNSQQESMDDFRLTDYTQSETGDNEEDQPAVVEYLNHGMGDTIEAHDSYLARNRSPWYVTDRRESAPILYTYMSRSRGRFVYNRTQGRNLNNLHSIYFDVEFDEKEREALLAYLNSDFADTVVKRSGRTYSTGMNKVEPAELEEVPILDPRTLNECDINRLASLFNDLCEASRNGDEDNIFEELDIELNRIFNR